MHLPLLPLVPSSFLATRHPPCILPSFSSVTSLYSLTSSSYATSSSYPTTFFVSCNTAFHPLQHSSCLLNPLHPMHPPLQPSSFLTTPHPSSLLQPLPPLYSPPLNPSSSFVTHRF